MGFNSGFKGLNRDRLNPLNAELNPICCLLALLGVHFLHVSRIRVKAQFWNYSVTLAWCLQSGSQVHYCSQGFASGPYAGWDKPSPHPAILFVQKQLWYYPPDDTSVFLTRGPFPGDLSSKALSTFYSPIRATFPAQLIRLDLTILTISDEESHHEASHVISSTFCFCLFLFPCGAATQRGSWPHSWGF